MFRTLGVLGLILTLAFAPPVAAYDPPVEHGIPVVIEGYDGVWAYLPESPVGTATNMTTGLTVFVTVATAATPAGLYPQPGSIAILVVPAGSIHAATIPVPGAKPNLWQLGEVAPVSNGPAAPGPGPAPERIPHDAGDMPHN